jgi:hypothetical protein
MATLQNTFETPILCSWLGDHGILRYYTAPPYSGSQSSQSWEWHTYGANVPPMAPKMAQTPSQQPRDVAEIIGECPERIQQRRPSIDGQENKGNVGSISVPPSAPEPPHEEEAEDEEETGEKEEASPPSPATTDNNPRDSNSYASLDQADDVGSQTSALSVASLGRLAKALETLCAVQAW